MRRAGVQLTERDIEIMRFINEFGFCEMLQIQERFAIKRPRAYQLMQRLVQMGLVLHQRIFYARHGVYFLSPHGASHTDLPPLNKVPLSHYDHHLMVLKLFLQLRQSYPQAEWVSERRLIQDKYAKGVGQHGHLADAFLVFPDDKKIAIEVELSAKGKNRTERILKGYAAQFAIHEVWYYCPIHLMARLTAMTEKMPFIKIFDLQGLLNAITDKLD